MRQRLRTIAILSVLFTALCLWTPASPLAQEPPRDPERPRQPIPPDHDPATSDVSAPATMASEDITAQEVTCWVPLLNDAPMMSGQPTTSFHNRTSAYVGWYDAKGWGRERLVAQWDINWVPKSITGHHSHLWLYQIGYYANTPCTIHAHPLTSRFDERYTSWTYAYRFGLGLVPWGKAGGDYDYKTVISTTLDTAVNDWKNMGNVTSVVNDWLDGTEENYGILYKKAVESGADSDRLFMVRTASQPPALGVYYEFTATPIVPPANNPATYVTPTNDHYFSDASLSTADRAKWHAFGIRPPSGANYDVYQYDNDEFYLDWNVCRETNISRRTSTYSTGYVDFVALGRLAPQATRYFRVLQHSGTGNYQRELATTQASLSSAGTFGPYSISAASVLKVFEFSLEPSRVYSFTLSVSSGDADLGFALYGPGDYAGRNARLAAYDGSTWHYSYADSNGAGEDETFTAAILGDDWYGLVIWNSGATGDTQFSISVEEIAVIANFETYLPTVLYQSTALAEENDRMADANGPLGPGLYNGFPDDANDYVRFDLSEAKSVTIRLTDFSATGGQLILRDDAGSEITKDASGGSTMQVSHALSAGTYYVHIYAADSYNSTTPYTLELSW